jgi:hypothetical protein
MLFLDYLVEEHKLTSRLQITLKYQHIDYPGPIKVLREQPRILYVDLAYIKQKLSTLSPIQQTRYLRTLVDEEICHVISFTHFTPFDIIHAVVWSFLSQEQIDMVYKLYPQLQKVSRDIAGAEYIRMLCQIRRMGYVTENCNTAELQQREVVRVLENTVLYVNFIVNQMLEYFA